MSVLTFLCFTTLIYFSLADPVPPTELSPDSPQLTDATVIGTLKHELKTAFEKALEGLDCFKDLDTPDKEFANEYMTTCIEEEINYLIFLCQDKLEANSAGSIPSKNDITMEFLSNYGHYIPGKADKPEGKRHH